MLLDELKLDADQNKEILLKLLNNLKVAKALVVMRRQRCSNVSKSASKHSGC